MIEKSNKMFIERPDDFLQEIMKSFDSNKQLKDNTRDLDEGLTAEI